MIKWLVQKLGVKPGAAKQDIYTTLIPITKDNISFLTCNMQGTYFYARRSFSTIMAFFFNQIFNLF